MPANSISHAHHSLISDALSFTGASFESGLTSTDLAKGAAGMVLTDDNFATINAAVVEGCGGYDNLIKFFVWTKSVSVGFALILLGLGLTAMVQLLFNYAPMMNRFLHTAPIEASACLRILGVAAGTFTLVEIEKRIRFVR